MKSHEDFISLQVVKKIYGAIVSFDRWHLESVGDWFIYNFFKERRLSVEVLGIVLGAISHVDISKLSLQFPNLLFKITLAKSNDLKNVLELNPSGNPPEHDCGDFFLLEGELITRFPCWEVIVMIRLVKQEDR